MQSRRLGNAGPEVSVVGLGCNNFGSRIDVRRTAEVVQAAVAAGISESYVVIAVILGLIFNKEKLKKHQWLEL